jgi:glycosyltransferase involved in cell wall biosynthesis
MDRPIAILFVITRLAVGGAPQSVLTAIRELKTRGYRIVLATGYPGTEEGSMIDDAQKLGVDIRFVPTLQRALHPLRDWRAFWVLWQIMRAENFDIVHTHLSKAGILGRLSAWLARVPVIVHTYHGDVLEGYFSPLKSKLFLEVERLIGRMTHRFVCVSKTLKDRFLLYHMGSPDDFSVIANGIVMADFESNPKTSQNVLRVGTLAMFYPIKRLDLFVEMAQRIKQRLPDTECVIAGGGHEESRLYQLSHMRGHPVQFLGILQDRAAFLTGLDVFVLCSDYEGAGMSLMEAMACGVPVVATKVGGVPEVVRHGETGVLVPPGNVDALTAAVCDLLQDPKRRQEMGHQAGVYARAHFSHLRMADELDAFYHALVFGP